MKAVMGKFKGFDFKQFAIDHGEKVGLGVVVLIAVGALVGTQWAGFDKTTPEELVSQVSKARVDIDSSDWPDEERQQFLVESNLKQEAEGLFQPIDITDYRYSTPMSFALYQAVEKSKEPQWLKPRDIIADSGHVVLALRAGDSGLAPSLTDDGSGEESPDDEPSPLDDEFAPRRGGAGAGFGSGADPAGGLGPGGFGPGGFGAGPGGIGAGGAPGGFGPTPGGFGAGAAPGGIGAGPGGIGAGPGGIGAGPGGFGPDGLAPGIGGIGGDYGSGDMMGGYGMFGDNEMAGSRETSRGANYVAVRAVIPLKDQAAEIRNALSLPNTIPMADLVDVLGFELERKRAVAGTDPWVGDWEKVDLQVAEDILTQASGWENEVVEFGVTDSVVTMPLPSRVIGYWGKHASHPAVDNFELSPEEQEIQEKRIEKLMKKYQEMLGNRVEPVQKAGFASMMADIRKVRNQVMQSSGGTDFMQQLDSELEDEASESGLSKRSLKDTTATGHLLLFRYFDFDVEPGNAYIYRLRLTLRNPNFGRPLEMLVNPDSAKGQTRTTDWTVLPRPAIVSEDTQYFLTRINQRSEAASMKVYQWHEEVGTLVDSELEMQLGEFIGGKARADVLRPAENLFETEDVRFASQNLLVDTSLSPRLQTDLHPELQLNKIRGQGGLVDSALVMDKNGDLKVIDPVTSLAAARTAESRVEAQAKSFEYLKEMATAADTGLGSLLGSGSGDEGDMMGGSGIPGSNRRGGNSRRRRGGKANSMDDYFNGMGDGMGGGYGSGGAYPGGGMGGYGSGGAYPGGSGPGGGIPGGRKGGR